MASTFRMPTKRILENVENPEVVIGEICVPALQNSLGDINKRLSKLDGAAQERIMKAAEEEGREPQDYLMAQLKLVVLFYLGCSTNLWSAVANEGGHDITSGVTSIVVTDLAKVLGQKATDEIFRTISYNVDVAVEEKFGPQLS